VAESIRKAPKIITTINRPNPQNEHLNCLPRRSPSAKPGPLPQPKPGSLEVSTHQLQFLFHHPDPVQPFWLALQMSRILYKCRENATNRLLFMQNKPNSLRGQINATLCATKDYENKWQRRVRKNKPKTNPIQTQTNPISEKPKMNLNFYSTKAYDNKPPLRPPAKQTQFKPNQTQFPLAQSPHPSQLPTPRNTTYEIQTQFKPNPGAPGHNTRYAIRDTKNLTLSRCECVKPLCEPRFLPPGRSFVHRAHRSGFIQLLGKEAILLTHRLDITFFHGRFKMLYLRLNLALPRPVDSLSLGVLFNSLLR